MNVMNSVDTKTLVHIGVEAVVIGGVVFWLNGRISGVQTGLAELQQKIQMLEGVIQQQNQLLSRHEAILRQMMGAPQVDPPQDSSYRQRSPNLPEGGFRRNSSDLPQSRLPRRPPPSQTSSRPPEQRGSPRSPPDDDLQRGPREMNPEDLDKYLEDELSDLQEERMECDGDQCTLKPKRSRKKARSHRRKTHGD